MLVYIPVYDPAASAYYVKRLNSSECRFIGRNSINYNGIGYNADYMFRTKKAALEYINNCSWKSETRIFKEDLLSIMDKTPLSEYKNLLDDLNNGDAYGYYVKNVEYPYFHAVLYASRNYIKWSNYGSSANRKTARDLKWIINYIFFTDLNGFKKSYQIEK